MIENRRRPSRHASPCGDNPLRGDVSRETQGSSLPSAACSCAAGPFDRLRDPVRFDHGASPHWSQGPSPLDHGDCRSGHRDTVPWFTGPAPSGNRVPWITGIESLWSAGPSPLESTNPVPLERRGQSPAGPRGGRRTLVDPPNNELFHVKHLAEARCGAPHRCQRADLRRGRRSRVAGPFDRLRAQPPISTLQMFHVKQRARRILRDET
jgi:hypothetical protein